VLLCIVHIIMLMSVLELVGEGRGISPTAVVSRYTLQWAALRRLGVIPPLLFFLIRPLVKVMLLSCNCHSFCVHGRFNSKGAGIGEVA